MTGSSIPPDEKCYKCDKKAWRRERDINRKWTGKYVCIKHYNEDYCRDIRKNNPNNFNNMIKSLSHHRTGNLSNVQNIFADNCQTLTCEIFGVDDLNKKNNNYNSRYDHGPITEHISIMIGEKLVDLYRKIPQTKGAKLTALRIGILKYEKWSGNFENELTKKFDYLIFYCASKDGKMIDRIYIIPKFEINITGISIYKNLKYATNRWYEKYIVADEEFLNKINDIWKKIILTI